MIDRFLDVSGRIPHIGDRVRIDQPNVKAYWARLRRLYVHEKREDLVAVLEHEDNGGEHHVMTDYVTRARDKAQAVRPANETSGYAEALRVIAKRRRNRR
jgi:hypothetical protein